MKIEIESNPIDVTPISEPDPNWVQVCGCGIEHRHHSDDPNFISSPGMCESGLPTLIWVVESVGIEDYPEIGHYECRGCGEYVRPGSKRPEFTYHIPGRRTIRINGEEVAEEELQRILKSKPNNM